MSFVVVLPTEPVMPTTAHCGLRLRHSAASLRRNSVGSSPAARRTAQPAASAWLSSPAGASRVSATAATPASMDAEAKSLPSTLSPGKQTNNVPLPTSRESRTTFFTHMEAVPAMSCAPVAATMSSTQSVNIFCLSPVNRKVSRPCPKAPRS